MDHVLTSMVVMASTLPSYTVVDSLFTKECVFSPCRLVPLELVQVGGGDACGLTTGAKALFCFTADTILAGEKEKIPEELLQLDGRLVEEAIVGLDGTTAGEIYKK